MNFFEQELQKLFADGTVISGPIFSGRACLGTLGKDLRVRAEFVTTRITDEYDALKITVLNRTGGLVDSLTLRFQEELGKKVIPGNPNFADGIVPRIWKYNDKVEWYAYQPTQADRKKLCLATGLYLDAFRDRQVERAQDGPKLVYICAPLRGELEKNIEFARQKAQEVFQNGDLPICPHLLFPPIADATDPVQDEAARDMGLRLVASCQQVNVYSTAWTAGMQAEIIHAQSLGIPVVTEQKPIKRTQPTARKKENKSHER